MSPGQNNYGGWDGRDRRANLDRRGSGVYDDTQPSYFEQMILQHLQHQNQPAAPTTPRVPENIAQSTLTISQIGSIVMAVAGLVFGGFSAWSNLNRDIEIQKTALLTFKESISKDVDGLEKTMVELKKINEEIRLQNQHSAETLERRIVELDNSVSQIYQKVSSRSTLK